MAKFYNAIGFATTEEVRPGVYEETIVERKYVGDVLRNSRSLQDSGQIIDDIDVSNRISIVADPYANENFHAIRYVAFMGTRWKVKSAEALYPRIILSLGGVYNGKQA